MTYPSWLKIRLEVNDSFSRIKGLNQRLNLRTVCQEALCPNIGSCWSNLELTYILLGKDCTRTCKFCNVRKHTPQNIDTNEPYRIAQAVKKLGIEYVVLTSVSRDDLADMGIETFLKSIALIKELSPQAEIEILIPDFRNSPRLLEEISNSKAVVVGHNIETVREFYPVLRPESKYETSLNVLKSLKEFNPSIITKSALLLGLGENESQIIQTIQDLKDVRLDILYLGQYLSPTKEHWQVKKFYTPREFTYFRKKAEAIGFEVVVAQPLARSSWKAQEAYQMRTQLMELKRT